MFSCESVKASSVTWGFKKLPLEALNLERSQCYVLLILLLQFGDNQAAEYFSFSSCLDWALYSTFQGVSPDISLNRNKQSYYRVRQDSDRKSLPGALEKSSDSPLFTSDCQASLFFREDDCCLTLNVTTEIRDSPVESLNSQYCACKWEFMFCYWLRMLKTDRLKYVQ